MDHLIYIYIYIYIYRERERESYIHNKRVLNISGRIYVDLSWYNINTESMTFGD